MPTPLNVVAGSFVAQLGFWHNTTPLASSKSASLGWSVTSWHSEMGDGVLCECAQVRWAFINRHRRVWPISVQCRVLQASGHRPASIMTGYHEHLVRRTSAAQRRQLSDDALLVHIKVIHAETHGACRWPRTWKELLTQGIRVGKERVRKRMQQHGIRAKGKRRFRITTDSGHDLPIAPSLAGAPVHGDKAKQVLGG